MKEEDCGDAVVEGVVMVNVQEGTSSVCGFRRFFEITCICTSLLLSLGISVYKSFSPSPFRPYLCLCVLYSRQISVFKRFPFIFQCLSSLISCLM